MNFCEAFIMEECNANPDPIDALCTFSECSFSLRQSFGDGQRVGDRMFDRQVTVWTGMVGNRLIGPFFVDGCKIRAEQYLVLLRESIVPAIRSIERELGTKIYFQQDGRTSAHKSLNVTDYLNSEFPNLWFGLQTRLAWPQRVLRI
ncbi:uncharacterized protein LOC103317406 [Nasonia vitripennis]|uniref:Transposase n=1 Tax=Nasonia vitripennis TaxID=7425 RepID=A0A7M7HEB2_NASVI|nr:uncharacterized protein LOC103317406 [Nasonia vitripennis]